MKNGNEKLVHAVSFRLDDTNYTIFKEKVNRSGLSPSEFFRACLLENKAIIINNKTPNHFGFKLLYVLNKAEKDLETLQNFVNVLNEKKILSNSSYMEILETLFLINSNLIQALEYVN